MWCDRDVYAIGYNGAGYRRITNSPACAAFAGLPNGVVIPESKSYTSELASPCQFKAKGVLYEQVKVYPKLDHRRRRGSAGRRRTRASERPARFDPVHSRPRHHRLCEALDRRHPPDLARRHERPGALDHPDPDHTPIDLAWRRDGGELAFSSGHEQYCSYYPSDIYAIRSDGSHYRRITNAPACAELAALPKGSVTVDVTAAVAGAQVYVMGAQGLAGAPYPGDLVTVNNVADFGPGVQQPAVGVFGQRRTPASPPYADVVPGQTVAGGHVSITDAGVSGFGAYKISWKADASALSYGTGTCNSLGHISSHPAYGRLGDVLPVVAGADPCQVAWGPTAAGDQYVYYSSIGLNQETGYGGIYLNSLGDASGGTQVVYFTYWDTAVFDMEWLPDGSGFLFTNLYGTHWTRPARPTAQSTSLILPRRASVRFLRPGPSASATSASRPTANTLSSTRGPIL